MKKLLFFALCLSSLSASAQWGDWGNYGGGGWGGGFGGGGNIFGGEGSGNSGNIASFKSEKDIDYVGDNHIGHKLDIYFPNDDKETHNVVIHIYGSAWGSNNSKGSADLGSVGVACLNAGYIFVAPNHRTYNDAQYPAQINDIKAVVRFLRGNAEKYGIDTTFIGISGFSSGGHLASLMGVTRGSKKVYTVGSATMDIEGDLGKYTNESSWVDAVCDWSGPVDCRYKSCGNPIQMAPENDMVGGCNDQQCPDKHALLGANTFITENSAPTMVCHGSTDNIVPQCEGKMFYDNMVKAGVDCEYYPHGGGHGVAADYTDEMIAFFQRIRADKLAKMDHTGVVALGATSRDICVDNNKLYLCNEDAAACTFSLADAFGRVLLQGQLTTEGVNISTLNKGVYLVRVSNGNTFKFIR